MLQIRIIDGQKPWIVPRQTCTKWLHNVGFLAEACQSQSEHWIAWCGTSCVRGAVIATPRVHRKSGLPSRWAWETCNRRYCPANKFLKVTAGIVGGRGASSKLSWAALIPVDKPHGLRGTKHKQKSTCCSNLWLKLRPQSQILKVVPNSGWTPKHKSSCSVFIKVITEVQVLIELILKSQTFKSCWRCNVVPNSAWN